ncbi:MAG: hypothetical protein AAGC63_00705 [Propionicimonas sp.]|nr:hypothetical protein [Propionicimonas sp.]
MSAFDEALRILEAVVDSSPTLQYRGRLAAQSLPDSGMAVAVEVIEGRTPLLRESFSVPGSWTLPDDGRVTLDHKLTRAVLGSAAAVSELVEAVRARVAAMSHPRTAYRTAVEVIAGREGIFPESDSPFLMRRLVILGYLARLQFAPATLDLYHLVASDFYNALSDRFDPNAKVFADPSTKLVFEDGRISLLDEAGELEPIRGRDRAVPRKYDNMVLISLGHVALMATGIDLGPRGGWG